MIPLEIGDVGALVVTVDAEDGAGAWTVGEVGGS